MFVLPLSRSSVLARRGAAGSSLNSIVDRLFDESFDRAVAGASASSAARTPSMDVSENDTIYTISFDVPGATREQLKVKVEGRRVSLETVPLEPVQVKVDGTADATSEAADRVLYRERTAPVFARTVSLPAEVDQAASQAKFDNGVLTLVLAKKVAAGATQLTIS
ncbi:MAG: Hsp20/alpha crystallin family protein [Caldimonas sp.]